MASYNLVQVYFLKPPTGAPWKLAYRKGDFGFTTPSKALRMEEAGVCKIIGDAPTVGEPDNDFTPAAEIEKQTRKAEDLTTAAGVKAKFRNDVEAMRRYCEENGIRVSKKVKRPETFWARIAKSSK